MADTAPQCVLGAASDSDCIRVFYFFIILPCQQSLSIGYRVYQIPRLWPIFPLTHVVHALTVSHCHHLSSSFNGARNKSTLASCTIHDSDPMYRLHAHRCDDFVLLLISAATKFNTPPVFPLFRKYDLFMDLSTSLYP